MPDTVTKEPIAIIGLGCVLPDAPDVSTFWNNLMEGRNSIQEVPPTRWDTALYYDPNKAPDRTYTKIGAFVADDNFQGLEYRMPPKVQEQVDPSQRWALSAARQALLDAGLNTGIRGDAPGRDFDRDRAAVIIGNAMGGESNKIATKRLFWPEARDAMAQDTDFQKLPEAEREAILERAEARFKSNTVPVTEDTMPGHLSNVVAGRIANVFDFGGKNFTTDAACASSLAALDAAMDTLRRKESDLVIWGGTDRSMDITPYVQFSAIGALSPDGSRPFDAGANGFVMGEGCAMFVLKRLADAERDGDTIHAVIRGVGGSSDGKGKGITAPNPRGQVKAVRRAYEEAEMDPYTVGYVEAHGTSTPVGDPVELNSVREAFQQVRDADVPVGSIRVGSVKSNIGHLKAAAGAAGMLKATLAVRDGVIPPSINVKTLNPAIEWATSPFQVATEKTPWNTPAEHPRRAAVSSFGFGGTNFHVVLEQYVPGALLFQPANQATATPMSAAPAANAAPSNTPGQAPDATPTASFDADGFRDHMQAAAVLEQTPLVLDADALPGSVMGLAPATFGTSGEGPRFRDTFYTLTKEGTAANRRVGLALTDLADLPKKLELASKAATQPAVAKLAFNQGVFLGQGAPKGKVAFLFPGQGTQYVNMGRDLAQKYSVVAHTFEEADAVLQDELDGVKLTDILWPTPDTPENQKLSNEKLKLTEFTQPAVLAMDVAILRLLKQWGIQADMVAGHSLGEYGALVAAGVLSFADALHAVAARGREMANVDLPDLGKMASIPADWETVSAAIKDVDEYVICANKNCPSQTVIAGSSAGVDAAVAKLTEQGLQCIFLPVSAAFHSDIVAPASKPLRNVLARLDVQAPKTRILSNVGAQPYGDDPEAIRDNLAVQVASPVEWIDIMERMYDEGVRTFIEVGPKKALTGFAFDILGSKGDVVAIAANHPKKGGIQHINELFAFLGAWGFQPQLPDLNDAAVYTAMFRDPKAAFTKLTLSPPTAPTPAPAVAPVAAPDARIDVIAGALRDLAKTLDGMGSTPAPSPVSAPAAAVVASVPDGVAPMTRQVHASEGDVLLKQKMDAFGINLDDVGISGISVGLPGTHKPLFANDDWDRILRGDNLIDALPESEQHKLTDKNIVRLVKTGGGQGTFQAIDDIAQVIRLAGRRGDFDVSEWGLDEDFAGTLDRTFQYAIAAGLEALRDAGIPLQRTYLQTTTGSHLPKDWKLPEPMRDDTGIVFASAFPGYDNLLRDISRYLADKYAGQTLDQLRTLYEELLAQVTDEDLRNNLTTGFESEFDRLQNVLPDHGNARYEFNRKFLFNVLSMGHAQLAQFIGARGPNTQLNAACASTTQAISVAEDWIRTGRCKRVLVVGADDVTSDAMFEWIGSGFLASGAATTKDRVEDAALPFDARRHGMIVGMGAVGLVVEATPETEARGMRPIAKLLATTVANSAFHGSRLDVDHISQCMKGLMDKASARYGIHADAIAAQTMFMSHETYTPARGGSASAEIHALRATFGTDANKVVIANTKGFTGHPQGAGVEDAIALKALQRGTVPPIANFRDPDPELGDLNLSKGGAYDVRFALRLAAGFGSQVAMTLTQLVAREDERVADAARYTAWLSEVSGLPGAATEVTHRTLRIVDQGPPTRAEPAAKPAAQPEAIPVAPAPLAAADSGAVLQKVTDLVATKTGYPPEMLEADLDMEADLGIDTVKQAELFGELRDHFGVPLDESLSLKDYNTLRKVADYMGGGTSQAAGQSDAGTVNPAAPAPITSPAPATDVLADVTALVAEKTGYPPEMLEADLDMEADLGIDTVKQAELFGELRDRFGVPLDENLQLKDYNTLAKVADYMGGGTPSAVSEPTAPAAVPVAAPAPSAPAATGHADEDVLAKVTAVIAEKTGYPEEMLEADLDMEADLGIDTVKQAELFGELRDHFGVPLDENLSLADYNTLRKVAAYMGGGTSQSEVSAAPSPTQVELGEGGTTPTPTPTPASTSIDSADVLAQVVALVAEKTGYPVDMLEPELDMEADLGIDTVKQAELFGELRDRFAVPMREDLQLKDYNTLAKVADYMASNAGGSAPESTDTGSAEAATEATQAIVRRVPMVRPMRLPGTENTLPKGTLLVVGDADTAFLDAWKEAGWTPTFRLHDNDTPVGLLCLATRRGETAPARLGPMFDAAKEHQAALKNGFVAVVTRQDGAHGLDAPRDATMAAVAGFGKALKKEFDGATVKVIDCHPDLSEAPAIVLKECLEGGRQTEIAYDADGTRFVVDVAPEALEGVPAVAGKTLVVPGGAQGITVELLAALAPQGPNFMLLGRTTVPEEAETWAAWSDDEWKAEEQRQMAAMKEAGTKVTPVSIQKAMSPLRKAAEVQRNLQRLSDLGAEVTYAPVDVTDPELVSSAVAHARERFGAIHGIIHAAGIEISKDLSSKDRDQFDWVFGIKHDGWNALMEATADDDLEFLVAFGSVAGRFGNIGQTDYSAANEYLCKAVKTAAAERNVPTAFTIAWGPWGEVGMATKGSILQIMESTGVTPIPTADGVAQFLAELATPGVRESVVAGNVGAIDADGQVVEAAWDPRLGKYQSRMDAAPERFALLAGIESATAESVTTRIEMDQATQAYARDHAIDGVPYLPGVFGLEAFAETASLLAPEGTVCTTLADASFGVPVKQLKSRPAVSRITATRNDDGTISCTLWSRMVGPDGVERGEPRTHFAATVTFGDAPAAKRTSEVPACTRDRDHDSIYPPFFHGPSFQVLRFAGPLDDESVGIGTTPEAPVLDGVTPQWHVHPLLVEALFQVCGLRTMTVDDRMSLPAAIERLDILYTGAIEKDTRLWGRYSGRDDSGLYRFDAAACTEDGTVLLRMVQYGMVETGAVPGAESEDVPEDEAPRNGAVNGNGAHDSDSDAETPTVEITETPSEETAAEPVAPVQQTLAAADAPSTDTVASAVPIPTVDLGLPDDTGALFAAVPVADADPDPQWFTEAELATAHEFAASKRADEWRAGRLAAKAAAIAAGADVTPLEVTVVNDEGGKPVLHLHGEAANYELSLTHRDGLAIAALAPAALGIDLETVEERSAAWREEAFNDTEAPVASDDGAAACMWAAKEAVFKRIGTGLRSALRAWTVTPDGAGGATVNGPDGTFGVRFWDVEGRVLAVSLTEFDPVTEAPETTAHA